MKTIKNTTKWILAILLSVTFLACKKEKNNNEVEDIVKLENLNKKIQDIIPTPYLDSLKKLGLTVNVGITPVNVEGYYAVNPLLLQSTNIPNDFRAGYRFTDARLKLFSQEENFSIKLIAKSFLSISDTSIVTAISGTGNDVTVYGKVRSTQNGKTADFAIIISGTMDNKTIKNFKYGLICISNKNDAADRAFIREGQGRVIYESDIFSTIITEGQFNLATAKSSGGLTPQSGALMKSNLLELK